MHVSIASFFRWDNSGHLGLFNDSTPVSEPMTLRSPEGSDQLGRLVRLAGKSPHV